MDPAVSGSCMGIFGRQGDLDLFRDLYHRGELQGCLDFIVLPSLFLRA